MWLIFRIYKSWSTGSSSHLPSKLALGSLQKKETLSNGASYTWHWCEVRQCFREKTKKKNTLSLLNKSFYYRGRLLKSATASIDSDHRVPPSPWQPTLCETTLRVDNEQSRPALIRSEFNTLRPFLLRRQSSHLSDDVSDVLFVLCSQIRGDFHQDWRFVFALQGIALLQHLITLQGKRR